MNIEYPPFYVGQQIIAIIGHSNGNYKKGDRFIVKDIKKNKCCGTWLIEININTKDKYKTIRCNICNNVRVNDDYYRAASFAPVEQLKYPLIKLTRVLENEPVSSN
jgi:hypothetical protein